jgi:O-antigen ligase
MLSRTTRWLWIALFTLVPIVYNPWSRWQFEPDKSALLIALTGLLVGSTLWHGEWPRHDRSRAEWWIAAYLAIRWLSLAASSAPDWSLWGDPAWRNGLWVTLAGTLLFMLARRQLVLPAQRAREINAILIGSAIVAAYSVLEYLSPFDDQDVIRAGGTQGHAVLLAAYLAMVMPFSLIRVVHSPHRTWYLALLVLQTVSLLFTYARAGWLAAMCGLGSWGIAWLWLTDRRRLAMASITIMIAGFVTLFALSLLPPLPGSAPHILQTLTSMFRWRGATAQIRLLGWDASLTAVRDQPWLGYGPATFRYAFEGYMPPELAPFGGSPALGGRMHNAYLEVAFESGLIGLVVYAAMLAAVLIPVIRAILHDIPMQKPDRWTEDQVFQAAALAALAANLVNDVFSFDSATTTLLFWSLAGMAHAEPLPQPAATRRHTRVGWMAAAVGIILAGWIVIPDMMVYRGEQLAQDKRWPEATTWIEGAIDIAPTPGLFYNVLGTLYADWATDSRDPAIWPRGAAVYADLIAYRDHVGEYHERRGLYLRRWHVFYENPVVADRAIAAYTAAIHLSPRDPDLWLDRGLMRLDTGDLTGALDDFDQANRLLDNYARYYGVMSIYALTTGDHEAAAAWNARAIEAQREWDDWVWRR